MVGFCTGQTAKNVLDKTLNATNGSILIMPYSGDNTNSSTQVWCEKIALTPTMAKDLLAKNDPANRTIKQVAVKRYAAQMLAGQWGESTILIDKNGYIIDGQHRLLAYLKALEANPALVIFVILMYGVDPKMKDTLDQGLKRNAQALLEFKGYAADNNAISATRNLLQPQIGYKLSSLTSQEVRDLYIMFQDAVDFASVNARKTKSRSISHGGVTGVIARAYYFENHQKLHDFLQIVSGDTTLMSLPGAGSAIKLREEYLQHKDKKIMSKLTPVLFGKTESALYAFLRGESLKRLTPRKTPIWSIPELDDPKQYRHMLARFQSDPSYRYSR